jgi:type I restriction enzyme S subunit
MEKHKHPTPTVRFPQFLDKWNHVKLSELLEEAKIRNEDLKYGKDAVLSVSGELGIVNQIEHLGRSYAGVSVHNYHVVEVGDIVYTKSPLKANPFGIIKINKGKAGIVSTLYAVYKVNPKTAYGSWIDYYFSLDANTNRYLRPLVKKGAKNDMKINNAYVLHDKIFVPSIAEQKRIASLFMIIDEKISKLKKKKELLEEYKRGVMQKLFSQQLRFKGTKGKDFSNWEKKRLGDLVEITSGFTFKSQYFSEIGSKLVTPNNFTKNGFGVFNKENTKFTSETVDDKYKCREGDLLILLTDLTPTCELLGKPLFLSKKDGTVLLNQRVIKINVKENKLDKYYLSSYLLTDSCHKVIKETATGSTVRHSSNKIILNLIVPYPTVPEQVKISGFLKKIDEKIESTESQIYQTQQWKKGLLQKMFVNHD